MAKTSGGIKKSELKKGINNLGNLIDLYSSNLAAVAEQINHLNKDARKSGDGDGGIWSGNRASEWIKACIDSYNANLDILSRVKSHRTVLNVIYKYNLHM